MDYEPIFDDSDDDIPLLKYRFFIFYQENKKRYNEKRYYFCKDYTFTEDIYKAQEFKKVKHLIKIFEDLKELEPDKDWCYEGHLLEEKD